MPSTATQSHSYDKNDDRRRSRLQAERAADAEKAAKENYPDPQVQPPPEKGTVRQPGSISTPTKEKESAQKLRMQQNAANVPITKQDHESIQKQNDSSDEQNLKQRQSIATGMQRRLKNKFSLKRRRKIKKNLKIIQKYENSSFMLAYAAAISADILDTLVAAFSLVIGIPGIGIGIYLVIVPLLMMISICLRIYLAVFIWTRSNRLSRKIARIAVMLIIDSIPIVNLLPATTLIIFLLDKKMEKRAEEAKRALKKLS